MPARESVAFFLWLVIATTTLSGHAAGSSNGFANASSPSPRVPAAISTKPPKIERAAEPEPRRARSDNSRASIPSPSARSTATASAAKPDAEDANPAPVGKSLPVSTRARVVMPARTRNRSRNAPILRLCASSRSPFNAMSSASSAPSKRTWVRVCNASSVMDSEPAAGRFNAASRLPQYLTSAMLGWAVAVASPVAALIDKVPGSCSATPTNATRHSGGVAGFVGGRRRGSPVRRQQGTERREESAKIPVVPEPLYCVGQRFPRRSRAITEFGLGTTSRKIHPVPRELDAIHRDVRCSTRHVRPGLGGVGQGQYRGMRQFQPRRATTAQFGDRGEDG